MPQEAEATPEQRVWQVLSMIPAGKVATYGQVASLAGMPAHARFVGRTLAQLPPDTRLPWHRVLNASLRIAARGDPVGEAMQKNRLIGEGVVFIGRRVASSCRWAARAG